MIKPNFTGIVLQRLRHKRGLTRKEAAKVVQLPESQLLTYEEGAIRPAPCTIKRIGFYYNLTLDEIHELTNAHQADRDFAEGLMDKVDTYVERFNKEIDT